MRIGLVDVDGHNFPNLALMKISAWHKGIGDTVEWANSLEHYDKVYMAKVFTFTKDDIQAYQCDELIRGGTGYNLTSKLPRYIETQYPDYDLYGIKDTAYGYLTRGCPRGCPFCIVGKKEGRKSVVVGALVDFWREQKNIKLLDPNILACPDWEFLLWQLVASAAYVDFTQGLDIRLMTDEKAKILERIRMKKIHFAWDDPDDEVTPKIMEKYADKFRVDRWHKGVYILTNYNSTHEQDLMRVYRTRELGYQPYVMIYDKQNAPKITRRLQRWCNNKIIFGAEPDFAKYKG